MKINLKRVPLLILLVFLVEKNAISQEYGLRYNGFSIPDMSGKAMTVLGPIPSNTIGSSLTHEHLFIDFFVPLDQPERWAMLGMKPPETEDELDIWHQTFSAYNRANLLSQFHRNRDAFTLNSLDDAINEVLAYRQLGGKTIVDVTTVGLNRQPKSLQEVAVRTGVNIIMGTGFYRRAWHPEDMSNRSVSDLTKVMIREIVEGVDNTGIKAGIIGEIPAVHLVFDPNDSNEVKVLRAAAHASQLTGAAITLHSSFGSLSNISQSVDLLEKEGADLSRVIVGHIATLASENIIFLEGLLKRGVYLQFDILGNPWELSMSSYPMVKAIVSLISLGYSKQILVSQDVCTKFQLTKYGGHGLTFIHSKLIPYLQRKGISAQDIKNIIEENPKRVLTFAKPKSVNSRRF